MHEVLVNRLGGLSLPRKSVVRLSDSPDITLDVYRGRKTIMQQQQQHSLNKLMEFQNTHRSSFIYVENMLLNVRSNRVSTLGIFLAHRAGGSKVSL